MQLSREKLIDLRENYGDAFYLLDSQQFSKNFGELKEAFSSIYSNFNIAYSYKTNYTPRLCSIVNKLGGYAEVVSDMEVELALRIGVKPEKIIWNGPIKNQEKVEKFLVSGGTVNLDSIEEVYSAKEIADRHPDKKLNFGIRCNFDVNDGVLSRFGFDIESEDFNKTYDFLITQKNAHLINLQCHFAKRQIEYWPARAERMIALIDKLGVIPERIDLGGGLFGKMDSFLKKQFRLPIPNYHEYATAVATIIAEKFKDGAVKPELLIEPGSAIVGDCMKFVGTVKTIKYVRGKYIASVLGSQKNISMAGINPPIEVFSIGSEQQEYKDIDLVGFTCIENDCLYRNYTGLLGIGDMIVISNCGSYSLVMKPPFILPNFPVLDISGEQTEVIKRAETFDDIFHTFDF